MSVSDINAEIRTDLGKGGARRTRRAGKMPAVLYGHGESPRHVALPTLAFATAIRYGGMTNVLTLRFPDGSREIALPKAIQRDPIRNEYEHADLLLVRRGEQVRVEVPVVLTGEPAKGVLVIHEHDRIAVHADATRLPDQLEVSIEGLAVGEQITAGDLQLPDGAELAVAPETLLAVMSMSPTAAQMDTGMHDEAPAEAGTEAAAES